MDGARINEKKTILKRVVASTIKFLEKNAETYGIW